MSNYIIINADTLKSKLEELEKIKNTYAPIGHFPNPVMYEITVAEKNTLQYFLSQSTPLIPEIEKAHNVGRNYGCYLQGGSYDPNDNIDSEDYISNLKLDI